MANKIGDEIRKARIEKGLSQKALASLCGTTLQNYKKIEDNIVVPRDTTVAKLAKYLDLELTDLLRKANYIHDDMNELSVLIITARLCKGLSKKDLAKQADLTAGELAEIETSKVATPYLKTLEKLSNCLDLDITILQKAAGYFLSDNENLCSVIKNARLKKNLTKEEAAAICEVDLSSFSRLEEGKTQRIQRKILTKVSNGLNLNLNFLLKKAEISD